MWAIVRAILIVLSLAGSFCCWCCIRVGAEYERREEQQRRAKERKR